MDVARGGLGRDFTVFWVGETISHFGSAITLFALPVLLYRESGSALHLALGAIAFTLPRLAFGLHLGAWADRHDRKLVMIRADVAMAMAVGMVPLAAALGILSPFLIYVAIMMLSTLGMLFQSAQSGAVPSLVGRQDLVRANGRVQAGLAAAQIAGPLIGGLLLVVVPVHMLLVLDAATFLASAVALRLIVPTFNPPRARATASVNADVLAGLRYVTSHPVLRAMTVMLVLVNFFVATLGAQIVLFAKEVHGRADADIGALFAAGAAGVMLFSLLAGGIRRRVAFGPAALGSVLLYGSAIVAMALAQRFEVTVILWGVANGLAAFVRINNASARQALAPEAMYGRIETVTLVLAHAAIPVGAAAGAALIEVTGRVDVVYAAFGLVIAGIAVAASFSALTRAERYLPGPGARVAAAHRA